MLSKVLAWGIIGINGRLCELTMKEKEAQRWRDEGRDVVELGVIHNDETGSATGQQATGEASPAGIDGPQSDAADRPEDTGNKPRVRGRKAGKG